MPVWKTFTFNGVNSRTYGIFITGDGTFDGTSKSQSKTSVAGRNGDIIISDDRYENQDYPIQIGFYAKTTEELHKKARTIRSWLLSSYGYCRLEDDYHPDEYRMAHFAGNISLNVTDLVHAKGTITFDCQPQHFLKIGEDPITYTGSGAIMNPTLFDAQPLLHVYGYGQLKIGTGVITLSEASKNSYYTVDCERWNTYDGKTNANSKITVTSKGIEHDYPILTSGSNTIELGQGISKVVITPRWWEL